MKDTERVMRFNGRILRIVSDLLVTAMIDKTYLYAQGGDGLPQDHIYQLGLSDDLLKRVLFFASIATVYGASSDVMFADIAAAFRRDREKTTRFFDPEFLAETRREILAEELRSFGIHRQNEMAQRWCDSAAYLCLFEVKKRYADDKLFCTDVVKMFERARSVTRFLSLHSKNRQRGEYGKFAWGISGLAGKTASLFVIFCKERGWLLDIKDAFPVDIWIMRICRQMGIIYGEGYFTNEEVEAFLRPRLARFCYQQGVDPTILNGAMWRLGAALCKKGPECDWLNCPVAEYCQGFARGATPNHKGAGGGVRGMNLSDPLIMRKPRLTLFAPGGTKKR